MLRSSRSSNQAWNHRQCFFLCWYILYSEKISTWHVCCFTLQHSLLQCHSSPCLVHCSNNQPGIMLHMAPCLRPVTFSTHCHIFPLSYNAVAHASVVCLTAWIWRDCNRCWRTPNFRKFVCAILTPLGGFQWCARWQILKAINSLTPTVVFKQLKTRSIFFLHSYKSFCMLTHDVTASRLS